MILSSKSGFGETHLGATEIFSSTIPLNLPDQGGLGAHAGGDRLLLIYLQRNTAYSNTCLSGTVHSMNQSLPGSDEHNAVARCLVLTTVRLFSVF